MLCWRSTRTGFYQMAIVLPATLMTRDSRSCSSKRGQRGLADRSNSILTNLNTKSNILPASPRRITYNEKDENSYRRRRVCGSLCRQVSEQEAGAQAGYGSDVNQSRKFYSLHADAA